MILCVFTLGSDKYCWSAPTAWVSFPLSLAPMASRTDEIAEPEAQEEACSSGETKRKQCRPGMKQRAKKKLHQGRQGSPKPQKQKAADAWHMVGDTKMPRAHPRRCRQNHQIQILTNGRRPVMDRHLLHKVIGRPGNSVLHGKSPSFKMVHPVGARMIGATIMEVQRATELFGLARTTLKKDTNLQEILIGQNSHMMITGRDNGKMNLTSPMTTT